MKPATIDELPAKLPGGSAAPAENMGEVPKQNLKKLCEGFPRNTHFKSSNLKRLFVLGSALLLSAYAVYEMLNIFLVGSLTTLETIVTILFAANFFWIALGFVQSLTGFFTLLKKKREEEEKVELNTRTAILMPIYNEPPDRVFALLEEMALEIASTPYSQSFDIFILSDSNQSPHILSEEQAFVKLRSSTAGKIPVYYRRRSKNKEHKSGNIEDFCVKWGNSYDHFIILDADSIMETDTLIKLAQRMQQDPTAGIIQTLPFLVRANTPFALIQQFASNLYGSLLGKGLAWWTQKEGNYWGHNAIIRTEAFMKAAGLPPLKGPPPFGGTILSHDFVEAALVRRAGWGVTIAPDLKGSYEESPPTIYDTAIRDRRWCQGNLQHSKIIDAKGLHWVSRLHLAVGIQSYLSSVLWLLLIISGLLLSLQAHYLIPDYFPERFSLFPTWPVMDYKRAITLFVFTMGILLAPKFLGLFAELVKSGCGKRWGGALNLIASFFIEIVLSALIAPIMMLQQSAYITSILLGKHGSWKAQSREGSSLSLKELIKFHWWHMVAGCLLAFAAFLYSWVLVAWVSPAIAGLVLSVPLSELTSSYKIGRWLKNSRLLRTPREIDPPEILLAMEKRRQEYASYLSDAWNLPKLLQYPQLMSLHLEMTGKPHKSPSEHPIDPYEAVTFVKVHHADCQKDLLEHLTDPEICYILSHKEILSEIATLPYQGKLSGNPVKNKKNTLFK